MRIRTVLNMLAWIPLILGMVISTFYVKSPVYFVMGLLMTIVSGIVIMSTLESSERKGDST
jgi:hypothetical protein